jgi:hypothetical protein
MMLYRQHECLKYPPTKGQVIWRDILPSKRSPYRTSIASTPFTVAGLLPEITNFNPAEQLPRGCYAFCGVLRNKRGERIVLVECGSDYEPWYCWSPNLQAHVIQPGTAFSMPSEIWCGWLQPLYVPTFEIPPAHPVVSPSELLTVSVGERDPNDASAFRTPYSVGLARNHLVGRLADDDRVEIYDASLTGLWGQLCKACVFPNDD